MPSLRSADEAHRSQYDFIDGSACHMRDALPHASFIGFTGTQIEIADIKKGERRSRERLRRIRRRWRRPRRLKSVGRRISRA